MEMLEIYADDAGETHFRSKDIGFKTQNYAPPSPPVGISQEIKLSTGLFLEAQPGWDDSFHPSPRKQLATLISGAATITATSGETISLCQGDILLLNDANSKGHLTKVQGGVPAFFMLIGLDET